MILEKDKITDIFGHIFLLFAFVDIFRMQLHRDYGIPMQIGDFIFFFVCIGAGVIAYMTPEKASLEIGRFKMSVEDTDNKEE